MRRSIVRLTRCILHDHGVDTAEKGERGFLRCVLELKSLLSVNQPKRPKEIMRVEIGVQMTLKPVLFSTTHIECINEAYDGALTESDAMIELMKRTGLARELGRDGIYFSVQLVTANFGVLDLLPPNIGVMFVICTPLSPKSTPPLFLPNSCLIRIFCLFVVNRPIQVL
jgi:hypothetical protein